MTEFKKAFVDTDFNFSEKFYGNLLFGEKHVLRNDDMVVRIT